MADLATPDPSSGGLTRLGRSAVATVEDLGVLADLQGTWIGAHGWEPIAVPAGTQEFNLIVKPYVEVVVFEATGQVPNRAGPNEKDLMIYGLLYTTRITDRGTQEPLHLENGMWLNLGDSHEPPIVRQATIPHGDVFLALGSASTQSARPTIPKTTGEPYPGPDPQRGYLDVYSYPLHDFCGEHFEPKLPNQVLIDAVDGLDAAGLDVVKTTTLSVSTEALAAERSGATSPYGAGGVLNIPFVTRNANATRFQCTYWIETVRDRNTGSEFLQLQYSQQADLEFLPQLGNPDALIMWPHVTVNTLRKQ